MKADSITDPGIPDRNRTEEPTKSVRGMGQLHGVGGQFSSALKAEIALSTINVENVKNRLESNDINLGPFTWV